MINNGETDYIASPDEPTRDYPTNANAKINHPGAKVKTATVIGILVTPAATTAKVMGTKPMTAK